MNKEIISEKPFWFYYRYKISVTKHRKLLISNDTPHLSKPLIKNWVNLAAVLVFRNN